MMVDFPTAIDLLQSSFPPEQQSYHPLNIDLSEVFLNVFRGMTS